MSKIPFSLCLGTIRASSARGLFQGDLCSLTQIGVQFEPPEIHQLEQDNQGNSWTSQSLSLCICWETNQCVHGTQRPCSCRSSCVPNSSGEKADGKNIKSSGRRDQERQVYSRGEKLEQGLEENQEDKNNQDFRTSS